MIGRRVGPLLCALAAFFLLPAPLQAQERADLDSGDSKIRIYFVPRLIGGPSVDLSIMSPFHLGRSSEYPSTFGFSAGWRHYFDGHGRAWLRGALVYERGGLFGPVLEGKSNRFGVSLSTGVRGITDDWVFGALALTVDVSTLKFDPPQPPFGSKDPGSRRGGWQAGVGVESMFGALFVFDPYVFAESGASFTLSRVELGPFSAWEVWGRWVLRFDWAIARATD